MYKCIDCNREFQTYKGLQGHNSLKHKIPGCDTFVNFYLEGVWPSCECGCKQKLNFIAGKFGKFILGHAARTNGGFYSKEGAINSGKTRKKKFKSGELTQWNKGKIYEGEELLQIQERAKNPIRCEKISKGLTGKPKSKEHIEKITADRKLYWSDRQHQLEQSERRMQYIINNGLGYTSKLEEEFELILKGLGIEYYTQFYVKEIKGLYDFKIKKKNILIEVDGDYWHCNPSLEKFKEPKLQWHFDNLVRDKVKNEWAEKNNYQLIRFWEHDINNNRIEVIQKLINLITT